MSLFAQIAFKSQKKIGSELTLKFELPARNLLVVVMNLPRLITFVIATLSIKTLMTRHALTPMLLLTLIAKLPSM